MCYWIEPDRDWETCPQCDGDAISYWLEYGYDQAIEISKADFDQYWQMFNLFDGDEEQMNKWVFERWNEEEVFAGTEAVERCCPLCGGQGQVDRLTFDDYCDDRADAIYDRLKDEQLQINL